MTLKRTPLFEKHVALGAKLVDFGGFEMPLKYTSETAEHLAVRTQAGIFDVSHMGEIAVEGPDALLAVARLVTNDPARIADGQAMYAGLLNPGGTFVDDVIVYRRSPTRFFICVNAGNREKDWAHVHAVLAQEFAGTVTARDEGEAWAQLAIQGPRAVAIVAQCTPLDVASVKPFHFIEGPLRTGSGVVEGCIFARTGYTGEDGFEVYIPSAGGAAVAIAAWDAFAAAGAPLGLLPCGLAARDTLRLEAGMCLYGNDIDEEHTPLEANIGWAVKLDGPRPADFIGAPALREQKRAGVRRLLRGISMVDRGIARHGYAVTNADGVSIGVVTSGTQAPFLNRAIAMAYVDAAHAGVGETVFVDVRGKKLRATVSKLPFYRKGDARPLSTAAAP